MLTVYEMAFNFRGLMCNVHRSKLIFITFLTYSFKDYLFRAKFKDKRKQPTKTKTMSVASYIKSILTIA